MTLKERRRLASRMKTALKKAHHQQDRGNKKGYRYWSRVSYELYLKLKSLRRC